MMTIKYIDGVIVNIILKQLKLLDLINRNLNDNINVRTISNQIMKFMKYLELKQQEIILLMN